MENIADTDPPTSADVYGPPDQALADLRQQTRGRWTVWFGHHTRRYWALPPARYPWQGLCDALTPVGLLERIGEVHACFGPADRPFDTGRTA